MDFIEASRKISMFCRNNVNTKKELPIRSSEMGMLIYLVKTDNDKTPISISKFFNVSKAMITNMGTKLIEKGYIVKQQSSIDKRSFTLIPTSKAIHLVEETYIEYNKNLNILYHKMGSEEFNKLLYLIDQANTILLEEKNSG